jgi:uncharacterized Zn-binding protein involved in type VI secretion
MYCHRNNDARECGAKTVVTGQDFVKVDGELWAVDQDKEDHGNGGLITSHDWLKINGKGVIVKDDSASADQKCESEGGNHCNPKAQGFDDMIDVK